MPSRIRQRTRIVFGGGGGGSDTDFSPNRDEAPVVILRVQIHSCHDLKAKDLNGSSGPFVDVSLLGKKFRKPVSKRNLNPVYATFDFPIYTSLVHKVGALEFVVWNKDTFSRNDCLGEYVLPACDWFKGTAFAFNDRNNEPFSINLNDPSHQYAIACGTVRIKVGFVHPPNPTNRPDFEGTFNALINRGGVVVLEISSAKDLPKWPNMIRVGWDMDPFVEVSVGEEVIRTRTIQHQRNPVWHERFLFYMREHDISLPIRLTVFDRDMFTSDDYVGEAEINIATLVKQAPKKDPNTGLFPYHLQTMLEFELPLISARKSRRVYNSRPTIMFRACYQPYGALRQQGRQ